MPHHTSGGDPRAATRGAGSPDEDVPTLSAATASSPCSSATTAPVAAAVLTSLAARSAPPTSSSPSTRGSTDATAAARHRGRRGRRRRGRARPPQTPVRRGRRGRLAQADARFRAPGRPTQRWVWLLHDDCAPAPAALRRAAPRHRRRPPASRSSGRRSAAGTTRACCSRCGVTIARGGAPRDRPGAARAGPGPARRAARRARRRQRRDARPPRRLGRARRVRPGACACSATTSTSAGGPAPPATGWSSPAPPSCTTPRRRATGAARASRGRRARSPAARLDRASAMHLLLAHAGPSPCRSCPAPACRLAAARRRLPAGQGPTRRATRSAPSSTPCAVPGRCIAPARWSARPGAHRDRSRPRGPHPAGPPRRAGPRALGAGHRPAAGRWRRVGCDGPAGRRGHRSRLRRRPLPGYAAGWPGRGCCSPSACSSRRGSPYAPCSVPGTWWAVPCWPPRPAPATWSTGTSRPGTTWAWARPPTHPRGSRCSRCRPRCCVARPPSRSTWSCCSLCRWPGCPRTCGCGES